MKTFKSLAVLLVALSLSGLLIGVLPGCESFKSNSRNDLLIQIAVTQGVVRFVDAGATPADKANRREQLISALGVARQFVSSEQPVEVVNWADEFVRLIDGNDISVADQVLISQVINLVREEIDMRIDDDGSRVYLGQLIDAAIKTAGQL